MKCNYHDYVNVHFSCALVNGSFSKTNNDKPFIYGIIYENM